MPDSSQGRGHSLAWAFLGDEEDHEDHAAPSSSRHTIPSDVHGGSSSSSSGPPRPGSSSSRAAAAIYSEIHSVQGTTHSRILTRIVDEGRTLECSWVDAAHHAVTRFTLEKGLTLLPGICMSSSSSDDNDNDGGRQLSILLTTSAPAHLVYRLCFNSQDGAFFSAHELGKGWHSEHRLAVPASSSGSNSGKVPVACHGVHGEETLVIAYLDGSLLEAQWMPRDGELGAPYFAARLRGHDQRTQD
jgi:hypothetical protein